MEKYYAAATLAQQDPPRVDVVWFLK